MENYRNYDNVPDREEAAGTMQEKVNATLEELQPEIDRINLIIEQLWDEQPQHAMQYMREAVNYLDEHWEYMRHTFLVAGHWSGPKIVHNPEAKGFLFTTAHSEAFSTAESYGFFGYQFTGHSPRVGLVFSTEPEELSMPMLDGAVVKKFIADPQEVTLHHISSPTAEAAPIGLEAIVAGLHETDLALKAELTNDSSEFYSHSADQQYFKIGAFVDRVNDLLPAPGSSQRLLADTSASMVYVQYQRGERLAPMSLKRQEIQVVGKVEGVTTYDMVVHAGGDVYFRDPSQCETARSGLMLVVSDYESSLDVEHEGEQGMLLVPLGRTSKLELSIKEE